MQHLLGPIVVRGDRAECHVHAWHSLSNDLWVVAGHYTFELRDNRITAIKLDVFFQTGNRKLLER